MFSSSLTDPFRFATEETLAEIHRVLKPGAKLGLIWNVDECMHPLLTHRNCSRQKHTHLRIDNRPKSWPATTQWEQDLGDYVAATAVDQLQTRFRDYRWPGVFDVQAAREKPLFSTPIQSEKVSWEINVTRDGLVDRVSTLSHIALMNKEEKAAFDAKVDEILQGDVVKDEQGRIQAHGVTYFAWSTRL